MQGWPNNGASTCLQCYTITRYCCVYILLVHGRRLQSYRMNVTAILFCFFPCKLTLIIVSIYTVFISPFVVLEDIHALWLAMLLFCLRCLGEGSAKKWTRALKHRSHEWVRPVMSCMCCLGIPLHYEVCQPSNVLLNSQCQIACWLDLTVPLEGMVHATTIDRKGSFYFFLVMREK